MLYDDADTRRTRCRTVDADFSDDEKGVAMTNEQAIAKLSAIYGAIDMVKDGVFVAKVDNGFEMFRIDEDWLEQRVEVDEHMCRWDVMV